MSRPLFAALLMAGAGVMAAQMITAIPHCSAVVDEPAHLAAGWLALTRGALEVNREHPPLVKTLAALPLLPLHPRVPPEPGYPRASEDFEFAFARRFLYEANDAVQLLARARLTIVALSCLLAVAAGLWGAALLGARIAGVAACLWIAFEPNLLAHGRLVTTDLAAALFAILVFAAGERIAAARAPGRRRAWIAATGGALGLALLSRFSGILLIPLLVAAGLLDGRRRPPLALRDIVVALLIALAVVNAGYLVLSGTLGGAPFPLAADPVGGALLTAPFAAMERHPVLKWVPLGVPRLWLEGLDLARWKNANVEGPGFLNGAYSREGWWSYFVQALGMKCTLGLILAAAAGALIGLRPGTTRRPCFVWLVLPACGLLFLVTALTHAQIGLRYVLPVIPFLCLLAAVPVARLHAGGGWRSPAILAGSFLLICWHAAAALGIHPYHIAYFNPIAGGPSGGYRHLVDSNLDWGQDLPGLRDFMDARGLDAITLYYFGTADPDRHGIRRHAPRAGWVAVSVTHLMGIYLPERDYFAPLRDVPPDATIGHSIHLYRLDPLPAFLTRPPLPN